jgi:hypothetical protein
MNPSYEFEIIAEVFRLCTGMMPPGKDDMSMSYSYEERTDMFAKWSKENMTILRCMINVFEKELGEKDAYIEDLETQLDELEAHILSNRGEI